MEKQPQQSQQIDLNLQNDFSTPVQFTNNVPKNKIIEWVKSGSAVFVAIIILICGYFAYKTLNVKSPVIRSYGECVKAKESIIQESYPQVCVTKNGLRFTEKIIPIEPSLATKQPIKTDYLLEKSEGSCVDDTQCQWAGEGCGGGHGICTNNPEKYKGTITTCDIVKSFPANRGYMCRCIVTLGKCGWKK